MSKIIIEREALHKALDEFLDDVVRDPLNIEDGEYHTFKIEGGGGLYNDNDDMFTSFQVKTSKKRML